MEININTPALLFPAISLVLLAYTNRFLAISSVIRTLHQNFQSNQTNDKLYRQIKNLHERLQLIKNMQLLGALSFIFAIAAMYFIYIERMDWAHIAFATAVIAFAVSLLISLLEIFKSTKALEIELSDMQNLDNSFVHYIKKKIDDIK